MHRGAGDGDDTEGALDRDILGADPDDLARDGLAIGAIEVAGFTRVVRGPRDEFHAGDALDRHIALAEVPPGDGELLACHVAHGGVPDFSVDQVDRARRSFGGRLVGIDGEEEFVREGSVVAAQ